MSLNICYYLSKFFFQTLYFDIKYDYYSTQNNSTYKQKFKNITVCKVIATFTTTGNKKNMEWHQWPRMFPKKIQINKIRTMN